MSGTFAFIICQCVCVSPRFDQLQAVDVEGVPPAVRIDMEDQNVLRPDTSVDYDAR